ncbi:unnamed protein product [Cylicocyclus nassatus]|uniref:Uncharacterized protein n=1 Tax=Cylicocyclus nassatus TaxID=53992 RepID=A0AA36MHI1_CYLNA|nr:unnamed protein product [Cylicocyclus nassatus]
MCGLNCMPVIRRTSGTEVTTASFEEIRSGTNAGQWNNKRLAQFVINKSSNQSRSKNAADLDCHHFVRRCAVLRRCSGKEHYKWTSHNHSSFCNIKIARLP